MDIERSLYYSELYILNIRCHWFRRQSKNLEQLLHCHRGPCSTFTTGMGGEGVGRAGYITFLPPLSLYSGVSVAVFKHHTAPITSVEWHHTDSSVFAASGSDNQVTLWDLAVERDNDTEGKGRHLDVPPQLLFIHMVWMSAEIRILSLPWNLSFRTPLFNTRDTSIHGTQKLVPLKCSLPSLYFITSID